MVKGAGFCVWVAGAPPAVVAAVTRAVVAELAVDAPVEAVGLGPGWLEQAPADLRGNVVALLAATLARHGVVAVVAGPGGPEDGGRAELSAGGVTVVDVWVGAASDGCPPAALVVPGAAAQAGESAHVVLRHLAAAGLTQPLDEYSDDDEAAVAGRLQNFGYL